ncbi:MAG: hypothetical protein NC183_06390 [Corallococcus sp.]|nr:hypothetical protein [Corallococcus sp.]
MGIAIKKLFCELLFLMFQFLDTLTSMFKVLCGTEVVDTNGEQMTLIDLFLNSSPIVSAFLSIFLISGVVIMISMIVAVFKKIIKDDGKKSHGKIAWQGLWAVVTSLVMAVVMFGGIFFANTVLQLVDKATTPGEQNISISQQIFQMCLNDVAYKEEVTYKTHTEYDINFTEGWEEVPIYEKDEDGNLILVGTERNPIYKEILVPDKDDDDNPIVESIDYVPIEGGSFQPNSEGGYYTIEDIVFGQTSVNQVFGVRYKTLGLFEAEDKSFEVEPMVRLDDFNVFLGYLSVIMLIVALVGSMLGLVKRAYDLVMLFLILPLVSGVIPLDDGARFKSWQSSVVSKVILAYGAVLSVNVYLLILPAIMGLTISGIGNFGNAVFRLFLMIGGALCINGGQLLMARVFGTSAEESREMAQSARALAAGAATAIHLPSRAMNAIGGQRVADGQGNLVRAGGLLGRGGFARTSGRVLSGVTNLAGNLLGGEAYRRPASAVAGVTSRAANAIRQGFRGLTHVSRQNTGMSSRNVAGANGGGASLPTASPDTSGTTIAANSGAAPIGGGGATTNPTANVGTGTPASQRANPFRNGVVGAAVAATSTVVNAGRNAVQSKRNNGLLPSLDTSKNNPLYVKPKANFAPKNATSSKGVDTTTQKDNSTSGKTGTAGGSKGISSALGAVKSKSADTDGKKGQYKKRRK